MGAGEPLDQEDLVPELAAATTVGLRVLALRLTSYAVGFVASMLISRAVGPSGRGLYALPLAFLGFSWGIGSRIKRRRTWAGRCMMACCVCYAVGTPSVNILESIVVTFPIVAVLSVAAGWEGPPNCPGAGFRPDTAT